MNRVIVLASGGLDSSLVMAKLLKEGKTVIPFFSNYNQLCYEGESKSVRKVRNWLFEKFTLPELRSQRDKSPLEIQTWIKQVVEVHIDTNIGKIAACPGRVLSFVGAACIWAFTNNWESGEIAIGIHGGDKDQDSCRIGYEDSLNECVKVLTQGCMSVITPLMGMSREEMAKEIAEIGIPWDIMYNCYWGGNGCGWQSKNMDYLCPGCRRKLESMQYVGVPITDLPNFRPNTPRDRPVARRDWTKWT